MTTTPTAPELASEVPVATAATADLVCWLWAAIPPKNGKLHVVRVAEVLGVHRSTIYRWLRTAHERELTGAARAALARRAILRGRGAFLWPPLDEASRVRAHRLLTAAEADTRFLAEHPERAPAAWQANGALTSYTVYLVHYRRAHVYGVSSGRTTRTVQRVREKGEILQQVTVRHRSAATLLKGLVLNDPAIAPHVCIPPRSLLAKGRTETWLESAGPVDLRTYLERIPAAARGQEAGAGEPGEVGER